jgi:hypothetical protein
MLSRSKEKLVDGFKKKNDKMNFKSFKDYSSENISEFLNKTKNGEKV